MERQLTHASHNVECYISPKLEILTILTEAGFAASTEDMETDGDQEVW